MRILKNAFYLLLINFLIACQSNVNQDSTPLASQQLETLFADYWAYYQEIHPLSATDAGLTDFNHLLPKIGEQYELEKKAAYHSFLDQLASIEFDALSENEQVNYDLFQFVLKDQIAAIDFERYLVPISSDGGFHVNLVYMVDDMPYNNEQDFQNYISRLRAIPDYMASNIELLRKGMAKKMTLPKVVLRDYHSGIDVHLVERVEESKFFEPFLKMPETLSEGSKKELENTARQVIETHVIPSFAEFGKFIREEYTPNAVEAVGISAQNKGTEFYEQQTAYFTTLPLSPEEIFKKGEQEVARIRKDMESIIEELNYEGSFEDFLNFLRTDKRFYANSPRDLLKEASYISKRIDGRLPQFFNTLPSLPYGVEPVPEAIAPKYTTGRYSPGSAANHKAGFYWVNTFKLKSRPLYVLPALTLHEAVPGHHLQIALAQELKAVPEFRKHTYLSSYGEGWALYCEWLGQEMGIYEDAYQEFGRMTYEMWRACRLVVDVGIHLKGWTRQQAIDFMATNTALSLHEINTEIDRYIGWPGQALSYKIGELKIRELRKEAEKSLGPKFDLRTFHDEILKQGAVPLFVLEKRVRQWIESNT